MIVARFLMLVAVLLAGPASVWAQEQGARIYMEGITVIGDQELPKVLYIVPWKEAVPPGTLVPPVPVPGDASFSELNREEFLRLMRYHKDIVRP